MITMVIRAFFKKLFKAFDRVKDWAESDEQVYEPEQEKEIYSLWDFLSFTEHTQAYHLVNVIGFEEWVDIQEIRRRILEIFATEYKNEKSLYPYLKTLSDINLFESTNIGGRRKWRKKELLFEINKAEGKENGKAKEEAVVKLKAVKKAKKKE